MYKILHVLLTFLFLNFINRVMPEDEVNFEYKSDIDVLLSCGNVVFQLVNHIHLKTNPQDCQIRLAQWLDEVDEKILEFNIESSDLDWKMAVGFKKGDKNLGPILEESRLRWRKDICAKVENIDLKLVNANQRRQLYFLCRGSTMSSKESETLSNILNEMQTIYTTSKICIPFVNETTDTSTKPSIEEVAISSYLKAVSHIYSMDDDSYSHEDNRIIWKPSPPSNEVINLASKISAEYHTSNPQLKEICFSGEPDLERLVMQSKDEATLRWAWLTWREKVGPPMRPFYTKMVSIKNAAAQRSGYSDLGEIWREELEIPNLENLMDKLYNEIHDLYVVIHGVARYFLRRFYGPHVVPERGLIPAHILGNMWAQSWESILDLILPQAKHINLNRMIKATNWTTYDLLKRAEDFYTSMGLPPMTEKFWKYSYFGEQLNSSNYSRDTKCHGTAANMFLPDDYRMIYCAGKSMEDFYVIHHEMGHIQYYMAYDRNLPAIFKDGANSAFQESIGDAIMYGALTPQHLQRLGLINDELMYNYPEINPKKTIYQHDPILQGNNPTNQNNFKTTYEPLPFDTDIDFDTVLLMRQALSKIPQIPYGYIIDRYRWDIFSGKIKPENYNAAFWEYIKKYQGLEPPNNEMRSEKYFDAGAKFHIPDNTPYVRYFLSSFLSAQMYRAMCQWSVLDKASPDLTIPMPLHRCDIYGSKKAGHKLREMMSKGSSLHWTEVLFILTGDREISSSAIHQYFKPLRHVLLSLIHKHNIPLGW